MRRRTFLKALVAAGISPSLVPLGAKDLEIRHEKPRGDRLVKAELKPLTNIGIQEGDCLSGFEEALECVYNLYSVDDKGKLTFIKTLTGIEYQKLSKVYGK